MRTSHNMSYEMRSNEKQTKFLTSNVGCNQAKGELHLKENQDDVISFKQIFGSSYAKRGHLSGEV